MLKHVKRCLLLIQYITYFLSLRYIHNCNTFISCVCGIKDVASNNSIYEDSCARCGYQGRDKWLHPTYTDVITFPLPLIYSWHTNPHMCSRYSQFYVISIVVGFFKFHSHPRMQLKQVRFCITADPPIEIYLDNISMCHSSWLSFVSLHETDKSCAVWNLPVWHEIDEL